jgi:subtilisin family serine protease
MAGESKQACVNRYRGNPRHRRSGELAAGVLVSLIVASIALGIGAPFALAVVPNDHYFPLLWSDSNTGQSIPTQDAEEHLGGSLPATAGAEERTSEAWRLSTGSRAIVIGEADTGVDYDHPDLEANVWTNPGNVGGCPAGTHGYNVLSHGCEAEDDDTRYGGHGTAVAGIIGAVGNNGIGVAGVNWQTTILPVKWLNQKAEGSTSGLIEALRWLVAAKRAGVNVRVVNDSQTFPGTAFSMELKEEIEELAANNILFVTAAGNSGDNNDEPTVGRYPCRYDLPNEICVTATDDNDQLPSWANYGPSTVDLAAPGVSIFSTLREDAYGYLSGGSMAAAQVAGAAGLILSVEGSLSATELKADILHNVDQLPSLAGKVITRGRLDVCKALPGCEATPAATTAATPAAAAPAAAAPAAHGRPASQAVELRTATLRIVHNKATIRLRCTASRRCAGKLKLTVTTRAGTATRDHRRLPSVTERLTIGRGTFSLRPGQQATVVVTLSAPGRALASSARGHLIARLTIAIMSPPPSATEFERVRLL